MTPARSARQLISYQVPVELPVISGVTSHNRCIAINCSLLLSFRDFQTTIDERLKNSQLWTWLSCTEYRLYFFILLYIFYLFFLFISILSFSIVCVRRVCTIYYKNNSSIKCLYSAIYCNCKPECPAHWFSFCYSGVRQCMHIAAYYRRD